MALAAVLALAAVSKVRSPRSAARGLETFRVPGPFRIPAVGVIAGAELVLAAGAAAGFDAAAYTAAAMLAAFAVGLGATLAGGGRGKPCACFGPRSRVSGAAVARNLVLAAAFVVVPSLPEGRPSAEGWLALGLLATVLCVGSSDHELSLLDREPDPAERRGAIRGEVRNPGDGEEAVGTAGSGDEQVTALQVRMGSIRA